MNLVEVIKNFLPADLIAKLSGLIGESEDKTKAAIGAAIPAVLGGLASASATQDGAEKVASAVNGADTGILGNLGSIFGGSQGGTTAEKGGGLLNMIFGDNILGGIIGALSKNIGLNSASLKKLLGYLAPIILGAIANQFKGKKVDAQGLTNLFAEQKSNIASALPAGLKDMPGLSPVGSAAPEADSPLAKWLLPLVLLIAAGALLWYFYGRPKPSIETPQAGKDATETLEIVTVTLGEITDPESAEKKIPKLKEASDKLDKIKGDFDKLSDSGKEAVKKAVNGKMGALSAALAKAHASPGVAEKLKPTMDGLIEKLKPLGSDKDVAGVTGMADMGGKVNSALASLVKSLGTVKDEDSAKEAKESLTKATDQLDGVKAAFQKLPEGGKSQLKTLLKPQMEKLNDLIDKVLKIEGVEKILKPILDNIKENLPNLVG
jgi:hypothetical protein